MPISACQSIFASSVSRAAYHCGDIGRITRSASTGLGMNERREGSVSEYTSWNWRSGERPREWERGVRTSGEFSVDC